MEKWHDPSTGEWLRSCAVVTTRANELVSETHDRMPAILGEPDYAKWLGEEPATPAELKALLQPYPVPMAMWPVSPRMNRADFDEPSVLETIELSPASS